MANKYETGSYMVRTFDQHGTKAYSEYNIESLIEAKTLANYLVENTSESYVIFRILINSKD